MKITKWMYTASVKTSVDSRWLKEQESQLLIRVSQSYLLIYSFKRKSAFDAFLFWCTTSVRALCGVVFGCSASVQGVESCKIMFLECTSYSPVKTFLLQDVSCSQCTASQTDRQTDDIIMPIADHAAHSTIRLLLYTCGCMSMYMYVYIRMWCVEHMYDILYISHM